MNRENFVFLRTVLYAGEVKCDFREATDLRYLRLMTVFSGDKIFKIRHRKTVDLSCGSLELMIFLRI